MGNIFCKGKSSYEVSVARFDKDDQISNDPPTSKQSGRMSNGRAVTTVSRNSSSPSQNKKSPVTLVAPKPPSPPQTSCEREKSQSRSSSPNHRAVHLNPARQEAAAVPELELEPATPVHSAAAGAGASPAPMVST